MGVDFLDHELLKSRKVHVKIFLMRGQKFFLVHWNLFFKLDKFWILAGLSRAQKKRSSEFTEFSTNT